MDILQSLQDLFDGDSSPRGAGNAGVATARRNSGGGGLADFINSGKLGPLAKSVLTNKRGEFSWLKGALLAGAGSMLWNKLSERVEQANAADPQYNKVQATPEDQSRRLIRALVYAAKSDGHVDAQEEAAIHARVKDLNLGREAEALVKQAINEPLNPSLIADGVKNSDEALQLYTLSSALVDSDNFMEKTYLQGLASALNIPADVKDQIDQQVRTNRR